MELETTYLCVGNMADSLRFYKALLEREPSFCNGDRWASFSCGCSLSLYNRAGDVRLAQSLSAAALAGADAPFNQAYLNALRREQTERGGGNIILNFRVKDLEKEYERLRALRIGELSEILYVNVFAPYYYFTLSDPDGNLLEITGPYEPQGK